MVATNQDGPKQRQITKNNRFQKLHFQKITKNGKIKLKVFLNLKSKKGVKSEKWFCTLPPPHLIHPHPLIMPPAPPPPGKKNIFAPCPLNPHPLIMPPAPPPPGKKNIFSNILSNFQHCGGNETLAHREMKLLLPGGGGAGGIIMGWGRIR